MKEKLFGFGDRVLDTRQNKEGYIVGITEYFTGCTSYYFRHIEDGDKTDWVDAQWLVLKEKEYVKRVPVMVERYHPYRRLQYRPLTASSNEL